MADIMRSAAKKASGTAEVKPAPKLSFAELRDAKLSRELVCDNIDTLLGEFS